MSAKTSKANQYHISNIHINRNAISWETHILRASDISHAWIGPLLTKPYPIYRFLLLLFLMLTAHNLISIFAMTALLVIGSVLWVYSHRPRMAKPAVHLMLLSGHILSFTADDASLVNQFYDVVKLLPGRSMKSEFQFDADGNLEERSDEETEEPVSTIADISAISAPQNPLVGDLQKLYQSYSSKADATDEIKLLIHDTSALIETGDRDGIKTSFKKFVTLGMIQDCNELNLNSLIQEIKNSIY